MGTFSQVTSCSSCGNEYTFFVMMPLHVCPDCYRKLPDYKERVQQNIARSIN